jgi:hypothetical protein
MGSGLTDDLAVFGDLVGIANVESGGDEAEFVESACGVMVHCWPRPLSRGRCVQHDLQNRRPSGQGFLRLRMLIPYCGRSFTSKSSSGESPCTVRRKRLPRRG